MNYRTYHITIPAIKLLKSQNIIEIYDVTISTQVLNELSNVLRKKFKLSFDKIYNVINEICINFNVKLITNSTILSALKIAKKYKYSFYDSLIISSAIDCRRLSHSVL